MKAWEESQKILSEILCSESQIESFLEEDHRRVSIIQQLIEVGFDKISHLDPDLKFVVFGVDDDPSFDLKVTIPQQFPKEQFQVDPSFEIVLNKSSQLKGVFQDYEEKVRLFKPIKKILFGLETQTRVIEASNSLWTTQRIIALAPGICLEITLDPLNPDSPPKILILGPDRKIQPLLNSLASNIHKYDIDLGLATNLERILEIQLPLPSSQESEEIESIDCGICYVYQLGNCLPTEVCDKCKQPFHTECLYEHLNSCPTSTKSQNCIFGKCPFCESDIFCNILRQ